MIIYIAIIISFFIILTDEIRNRESMQEQNGGSFIH